MKLNGMKLNEILLLLFSLSLSLSLSLCCCSCKQKINEEGETHLCSRVSLSLYLFYTSNLKVFAPNNPSPDTYNFSSHDFSAMWSVKIGRCLQIRLSFSTILLTRESEAPLQRPPCIGSPGFESLTRKIFPSERKIEQSKRLELRK